MLTPLQASRFLTVLPLITPEAQGHHRGAGISVSPIPALGAYWARAEIASALDERQAALLEAVHEARTTLKVDLGLFSAGKECPILGALLRKMGQGVRVQVLASDDLSSSEQATLAHVRQQGLLVRATAGVDRNRKGMVADDRVALLFDGALRLAGEAAWELGRAFNQCWSDSGGNPASMPERPHPFASAQASTVRIGDRQHRAPRGLLVTAISAAKYTIDIQIEALNDAEILAALKTARGRGVTTRVLLKPEKNQGVWSSVFFLREIGAASRIDPREELFQSAAIDGQSMILASAGWTPGDISSGTVVFVHQPIRHAEWQRAFEQAWTTASPPSLPGPIERLAFSWLRSTRPALIALSRLARRNWRLPSLHLGFVNVAGQWRFLAETR